MTAAWSIAPDAANEPTLWRWRTWDDPQPAPVARRGATHPVMWALAELLVADTPAGRELRDDVLSALAGREVAT